MLLFGSSMTNADWVKDTFSSKFNRIHRFENVLLVRCKQNGQNYSSYKTNAFLMVAIYW